MALDEERLEELISCGEEDEESDGSLAAPLSYAFSSLAPSAPAHARASAVGGGGAVMQSAKMTCVRVVVVFVLARK